MEENIKAYEKPSIIVLPLNDFFFAGAEEKKAKTKKTSSSKENKGVKGR